MANRGHTATIGRPSPLETVKRALLRRQRLRKSLGRAKGERKASLETELERLEADLAEVKSALDKLAPGRPRSEDLGQIDESRERVADRVAKATGMKAPDST